ncbi:hypothetical protein D3C81_1753990 [compost metagenome]
MQVGQLAKRGEPGRQQRAEQAVALGLGQFAPGGAFFGGIQGATAGDQCMFVAAKQRQADEHAQQRGDEQRHGQAVRQRR